MLCADNNVLVYETWDGVNAEMERWRETIEPQRVRLSWRKQSTRRVIFRNEKEIVEDLVTFDRKELPLVSV